jgi:hypothetical protein
MTARLTANCWKLLFRILLTIMQRDFVQDEQKYLVEIAELTIDATKLGKQFIAEGY